MVRIGQINGRRINYGRDRGQPPDRGPRPISVAVVCCRPMAIFGPMYSISTDSISMKTNGSDFEDGAFVRCVEDRNKSQKTVKIEITSGSL